MPMKVESVRCWVDEHYLYRSVTVTMPAVRMVVVKLYREVGDDGKPDFGVEPIVAIRTAVRDRYTKVRMDVNHEPDSGATHGEMISRGWRWVAEESGIRSEMLVMCYHTCEHGTLEDAEEVITGIPWWILACPWPAEQDGERIAKFVGEMMDADDPTQDPDDAER